MTVRHQGGGHKRLYRVIDFKRNKDGIPARVATIEYDPNRSARIALLNYVDGEKRYILAPDGIKVGDQVVSGPDADIKPGNALPIKNIPVGTMIHNVELKIGKGAQLVRSAGTAAQLMNVALPRVRDFRGVSAKAFDGRGNYSVGLREQLIFPEIEYDKIDKLRGMNIVVVTTAKTDEEARELLKLMSDKQARKAGLGGEVIAYVW